MNAQDRALVQELATGLLRDIKYRPEQKSKLGHHEVKELSLRLRDYEEALQAAEQQAEEREKRCRKALETHAKWWELEADLWGDPALRRDRLTRAKWARQALGDAR